MIAKIAGKAGAAPHERATAPKAGGSDFAHLLGEHLGEAKKKKTAAPPAAAHAAAPTSHQLAAHAQQLQAGALPPLIGQAHKHAAHAKLEPARKERAAANAEEKPAAHKPEAPKAAQAAPQLVKAEGRPAEAPQPAPLAPAEPRAPRVEEPRAPAPPPQLELPHDPTLSVAMMPRAAHLSLRTEELGEVRLHLRVRDGVADVRIDATHAQAFGTREAELRNVLAAEGLTLGSYDLPQREQPRQGDAAPGTREEALPQRAPSSQPATRVSARHAGRIDVEA